jgi:multidrug efflux pump subunit AcrB
MNPAAWCIRNSRTAATVFVLVAALGAHTFMTMSRLENPDFTFRTALVVTYFPGASPQRVEQLLSDPLEEKLREIPELDRVESQSMAGVSVITVHMYEHLKDTRPVWNKLRNKIDDARGGLPDGVIGPNVNDEFGDVFGVVVALTGDGHTYRELKDVADDVRDELLKIGSVAKVDLYGTQDERIFIEFSNARLAEYGYSPYTLMQLLRAQNAIQPGGRAVVGGESVIIEATGEFQTLGDLRQMSFIAPGTGNAVNLGDIATIRRDFVDPPTSMARFNGKPSIVLAVSMADGNNIIDMGDAVQQRLRELTADLEVGLSFETLVYQPRFVERSIDDFMHNLLEAFAFVFIVVLVFTGLRAGMIVGLLVPMAMLASVALMPAFDVDLQQVSIASLIIALGILVDNGIVMSENILVRLEQGEERMSAVTAAVQELWVPLLTSSIATVLAFLPIATARSTTGEYCLSLFIVVGLTLGMSFVLSLTMIPMLCYYTLKPGGNRKHADMDTPSIRFYRKALMASLRHPWRLIGAILAAFVVALWGFRFVPKAFFPPNEREMFVIDFWQPSGTDIRATAAECERLEALLLQDPEVVSVGTFVGTGGPRWYLSLNIEQDLPSYAFLVVNTRSVRNVAETVARTRRMMEEHFPESRHAVNLLELGPPVGAPIQVRLSGPDIETLYHLRAKVVDALRGTDGVRNVRDDWGEWTKKLLVDVNQDQAKLAGLTSQDIALSLQTEMSGLQASEFREGKEQIPIVVRSEEAFRRDLARIEGLNLYSFLLGRRVPLLQVATPRLTWEPSNIRRRNQERTMTVKADVVGRFASDALAEVMPKLQDYRGSDTWPIGYDIAFGGEEEESEKASSSIVAGLPLAGGLIFLTLMSQFNSLRSAIIILLTIPWMIIGIVPGMLLTGVSFGFMAMLGMISLAGLIVNHTIVMADCMKLERASGKSWKDAIVSSAIRRFRPIMMTIVTAVVSLIPLSIRGGGMWQPMANLLISGMLFSTVLTLLLYPALCALSQGVRYAKEDPA